MKLKIFKCFRNINHILQRNLFHSFITPLAYWMAFTITQNLFRIDDIGFRGHPMYVTFFIENDICSTSKYRIYHTSSSPSYHTLTQNSLTPHTGCKSADKTFISSSYATATLLLLAELSLLVNQITRFSKRRLRQCCCQGIQHHQ